MIDARTYEELNAIRRNPRMVIGYRIFNADGSLKATGRYRYDDDAERRRFGEGCRDAMLAFERVETWRIS